MANPDRQLLEAAAGIEPANSDFADRCLNHLATPPPKYWSGRGDSNSRPSAWQADALPTELLPHLFFYWFVGAAFVPRLKSGQECPSYGRLHCGAGKGIRTPDPQLGKLMLYRLSYSRPPLCRCRLLSLCCRCAVVKWWAVQGLNLRPLPCEESALPAELTAHFAGHTLSGAEGGIRTRTNLAVTSPSS